MIRLALTGSFAMGKTTTSCVFADHGVPVHASDAAVRKIYEPGGAATAAVAEAFGSDALDAAGRVDRRILGRKIWDDPPALRRLEQITHPLIAEDRAVFIARHEEAPLVVLDIPLLFEHVGAARFDAVAVVTCPADEQRRRALARPGMTPHKLTRILALQLPDVEKRRRADFVINAGLSMRHVEASVRQVMDVLSDHA